MEFNFEELMKTIGDEITMRTDLNNLRAVAAKSGRKITQEEVGKNVGCSDSLISLWLNGHRMLNMELRIKMYQYLRELEKQLGVK